jgi:DnaA N-terminal domain
VEIARIWYFVQMTTAIQLSKEREAVNLWDKFLERVKSRVSINTFNTWFQPTRLNRSDADMVYV